MERLTPENCEKLQQLGLPVDFANGSFFKADGQTYCYCAVPYILNSHECIPCWSLNNLFNYLKKTYGNDSIVLRSQGSVDDPRWIITINPCMKTGLGDTVLESVYDVIIKILEDVRYKDI